MQLFNNDGTKLFVVGHAGDKVYEYSLDNPAVQTVAINSAITNITFNTIFSMIMYNIRACGSYIVVNFQRRKLSEW